jgi:hypothetical protein
MCTEASELETRVRRKGMKKRPTGRISDGAITIDEWKPGWFVSNNAKFGHQQASTQSFNAPRDWKANE